MKALLEALINGAILSAPLAAAVWLALRTLPRRSMNAATRHLVWWAALVITIALPILFLPHQVSPSRPTPGQPETVRIQRPAPSADTMRPMRLLRIPAQAAAGHWPERILWAWALIAMLLSARLMVSYVLLRRIRTRSTAPPEHLAARVDQWLATCGSSRKKVRLAISAEVAMPMVAGLLRPTILIPAHLLNILDEAELDQIGLHEAAHVARGDGHALIVQRVVEAVFALNPVVHWITRRIALEREITCDDFVVQATAQPRSYAACLIKVVELAGGAGASPVAATATGAHSHLALRVDTLLDNTRHCGTRPMKSRLAAALAGLAALACIAAQVPGPVIFAQEPALVRISASVLDPLNRFVTGLEQENFKLIENGVEQEITRFSPNDAPISVGIIFENGNITAVTAFLKTAHPADEFFLVQCKDHAELIAGFTPRAADIQNALPASPWTGKSSLTEGINLAMREMNKAKNLRKALLVIAAGNATIENPARHADVQMYVLDGSAVDAPTAAVKTGIEIRNQYVLGYSPKGAPRGGTFHTVQISLMPPRGWPPLHVRMSSGYYGRE